MSVDSGWTMSPVTASDRSELGAILVAAEFGPPPGYVLICLLARDGLRSAGSSTPTSGTWGQNTGTEH
jgi:hypothetical protein